MSIHSEIKRLRLSRGWSYERLAAEVSTLEMLQKPLAWQAVQQWENEGGTAPKRKRLEFVAKALGSSVPHLLAGSENAHSEVHQSNQLEAALTTVFSAFSGLSPKRLRIVLDAMEPLAGHPEMCDEVLDDALMVLQARPGKRQANGQ